MTRTLRRRTQKVDYRLVFASIGSSEEEAEVEEEPNKMHNSVDQGDSEDDHVSTEDEYCAPMDEDSSSSSEDDQVERVEEEEEDEVEVDGEEAFMDWNRNDADLESDGTSSMVASGPSKHRRNRRLANALPRATATALPATNTATSVDPVRLRQDWERFWKCVQLCLLVALQPPSSVHSGASVEIPTQANQKSKECAPADQERLAKQSGFSVAPLDVHPAELAGHFLIAQMDPSTGLYACPIPGCSRPFKVFASLKYHMETFDHDVVALLQAVLFPPVDAVEPLDPLVVERRTRLLELFQEALSPLPASLEEFQQLVQTFSHDLDYLVWHSLPFPIWFPTLPRFWMFPVRLEAYHLAGPTRGGSGDDAVGEEDDHLQEGTNRRVSLPPRRRSRRSPLNARLADAAKVQFIPVPKLTAEEREWLAQKISLFPQTRLSMADLLSAPPAWTQEELNGYLPKPEGHGWKIVHSVGAHSPTLSSERVLELGSASFFDVPAMEKCGFLIHAGGSVWITEWVPGIPATESPYLLIGGMSASIDHTHDHCHPKVQEKAPDAPGALQLWKIPRLDGGTVLAESVPTLDLVLLHDHGTAWAAQWCPRFAYDEFAPEQQQQMDPNEPTVPRLGLLAVLFGNGTICLYSVPHPSFLRQIWQTGADANGNNMDTMDVDADSRDAPTLYWKPTPIWTAALADKKITTFAWSNDSEHQCLAAGCADGTVAVWNLNAVLNAPPPGPAAVEPWTFSAHKVAVRSIAWFDCDSEKGRQMLTSAGQDGRVLIWDLQSLLETPLPSSPSAPSASLEETQINRSLMFIHNVLWSRQQNGIVWTGDTTVRRVLNEDLNRLTWVGFHDAAVWCVDASAYHEFLVSAGADGSVRMVNPTVAHRAARNLQIILYQMEQVELEAEPDDGDGGDSLEPPPPPLRHLTFHESRAPMDLVDVKNTHPSSNFRNMHLGVQTVRWNPTLSLSTWIASGGRSGLVRIEKVVARYDRIRKNTLKKKKRRKEGVAEEEEEED